jgi:hypothetical protein
MTRSVDTYPIITDKLVQQIDTTHVLVVEADDFGDVEIVKKCEDCCNWVKRLSDCVPVIFFKPYRSLDRPAT